MGDIMTAVTMATSAVGAFASANAQTAASRQNSMAAEYNARLAQQQAEDARRRGAADVKKHNQQVRQLQGRQRSSMAAGGIMVDSGSALDVIEDTAYWGALDAETISRNAARDAWGYESQAESFLQKASQYDNSASSPWLAAGMSLLSGASNQMASEHGLFGWNPYQKKKKTEPVKVSPYAARIANAAYNDAVWPLSYLQHGKG